jgi:hypothetical protein
MAVSLQGPFTVREMERKRGGLLDKILLMVLFGMCTVSNAYALPSFARQTGQRCAACHVGETGRSSLPGAASLSC